MLARILDAERRQAPRYRLQLPVVLSWADDQQMYTEGGFTRDVSVKGLFVTCALVPPLGKLIDVQVLLPSLGHMPENTIRARGYVVRACESSQSRGIAIAAELCVDIALEGSSESKIFLTRQS